MNRFHLPLCHSATSAGTRAVLVGALATCAALCGPANAQDQPATLLKPPITQWQQPPMAPSPSGSASTRPSAAASQSMPVPAPKPAPTRIETLVRPAIPAPAAPQTKPETVKRAETMRAQTPAQAAQPVVAPMAANTVADAAKAPALAGPSDFGAVARLLEFQASGLHAGPAQWISGRDASASYQRFLAGENDAAPAGKQQSVGDYGMQRQTIMQPAGVQVAPTGR